MAADQANTAVSDAEIDSLISHGYEMPACDYVGGDTPSEDEGEHFVVTESWIREVAELVRRSRQPQPDRAVEALRGLVEACDPVADALQDIAGDAHDAYLDRCWSALRTAREVLDGR